MEGDREREGERDRRGIGIGGGDVSGGDKGDKRAFLLSHSTPRRYQRTEDSYIYPYKLIRLTSKFIKFRVVKVTRKNALIQ